MSKIEKFQNFENSSSVSWEYNGIEIRKMTDGRLIALQMKSGNVLIIYINREFGADNAFIYDPLGSEIVRIKNPLKDSGAICFDDAYYSDGELTLIIGHPRKRIACVIGENGETIEQYETK